MRSYHYSRTALILCILGFLLSLVVTPLYSQGEGKGRDKDGDQGQGNGQQHNPPGQENRQNHNPPGQDHNPPGQENRQNHNQPGQDTQQEQEVAPLEQQQSESLLGCQKNNPDRLDCSSLEVSGYCDGTTAVFVIRNTGEAGNGDMLAATSYQILQDGSVVQSGSVQLGGGQSMTITYDGGGEITLLADQQVGHPGNSHPRVTLNCGNPEPTPTEEVTPTDEPTPTEEVTPTDEPTPTEEVTPEVTPTEEVTPEVTPTEEVTPEVDPPDLYAGSDCYADGSTTFYVGNAGGAMSESIQYVVTDSDGNVLAQGSLQLDSGEIYLIELGVVIGQVTLNIGNGLVIQNAACLMPTEEVYPPELDIWAYCDGDGAVVFEVYNVGTNMAEPLYYTVTDMNGSLITDGWLQLAAGGSTTINVGPQDGVVSLLIGDWVAYQEIECVATTEEPTPTEEVTPEVTPTDEPTPTEEVTPEVTPTEEVTPEVTPTEEVTPEVTPTEEVTPEVTPAPNCSKHNSDRLDCSSLNVTAYCDGDVAVFIIRNGGKPGEGDMVAPTEYRLIQDGTVIESGSVQIAGGDTLEIHYNGGGEITLEADQQIGHPGKSQPQATINCGS